jgi:ATP-binding cassette subfamily C protein PrsD
MAHETGAERLARAALRHRLPDFAAVGVFSSAVNILMLTGSIYMLEVYDRVLVSRSVETLVVLSLMALLAFGLQGGLDMLRSRILARIGAQIDAELAPAVYRAATLLPLTGAPAGEALAPARDAETLRSFLSSNGPSALFDIPFLPIFLFGAFLIHPLVGLTAVLGAAIIIGLTVATDWAVRSRNDDATGYAMRRQVTLDAARRHAEAISAMGMGPALSARWEALTRTARDASLSASDALADLGGIARIFRIVLQSGVLGLGAYLAIKQEISAGAMIAASILISRSLAPVESAIANWRGFVASREAVQRLDRQLASPAASSGVDLPAPKLSVRVESITVTPPGRPEPVISNASFGLAAGSALAVIGPSGAGKSSLARALVGLWAPTTGEVRIDGATLGQWPRAALGRHIGFLPQDLALPDGTIAETIARFDQNATSEAVIKAARAAGAHDLIVSFPDGYGTRIGDGGSFLSSGQRQRIGIARALYGDPFLVVLDEPNSNLDAEGDEALARAIAGVRQRGGIAVVVTHRPSTLTSVDLVALVMEGGVKLFGPRDEVLKQLSAPAAGQPGPQPPQTIHVVKGGRTP